MMSMGENFFNKSGRVQRPNKNSESFVKVQLRTRKITVGEDIERGNYKSNCQTIENQRKLQRRSPKRTMDGKT